MSFDRKKNNRKNATTNNTNSYAEFPHILYDGQGREFVELRKVKPTNYPDQSYPSGEYPALDPVFSDQQIYRAPHRTDYSQAEETRWRSSSNSPSDFPKDVMKSPHDNSWSAWNNNQSNFTKNDALPYQTGRFEDQGERSLPSEEREETFDFNEFPQNQFAPSQQNRAATHYNDYNSNFKYSDALPENFSSFSNNEANNSAQTQRGQEQMAYKPVNGEKSALRNTSEPEFTEKHREQDLNDPLFAMGEQNEETDFVKPVEFGPQDYESYQPVQETASEDLSPNQKNNALNSKRDIFPWQTVGVEVQRNYRSESQRVHSSQNTGEEAPIVQSPNITGSSSFSSTENNSAGSVPATDNLKPATSGNQINYTGGYGTYRAAYNNDKGQSFGVKSSVAPDGGGQPANKNPYLKEPERNRPSGQSRLQQEENFGGRTNNGRDFFEHNRETLNPYSTRVQSKRKQTPYPNLEQEQTSFAEDFARLDADTRHMDNMVDEFANSSFDEQQFKSVNSEEDIFRSGIDFNSMNTKQFVEGKGNSEQEGFGEEFDDNGLYNWAAPTAPNSTIDPQEQGATTKKGRKYIYFGLIILILALIAAVAYWFYADVYNEYDGAPIIIHKAEKDYKVKPNTEQKANNSNQEKSVTDGLDNTDKSQQKNLIDKSENPINMQFPGGVSPFNNEEQFDQSSIEPLIQMAAARASPVHVVETASIDGKRRVSYPQSSSTETANSTRKVSPVDRQASQNTNMSSSHEQVEPTTPMVQSTGPYFVQISSQPSREAAERSISSARSNFPAAIASNLKIVSADIPGKGTYYRVRIPAQTREQATEICNEYKRSGKSCFVGR